MLFLLVCCFPLVLKYPICEASISSRGKNENDQTLCYPNYFWDNGECKACPSGFFGTHCSTRCPYPNYGKLCKEVCHCNATDCDHVFGCQRNNSEIETITGNTKSEVLSRKAKSEYSTAQTASYETQEKSENSTPQTELYDYQGVTQRMKTTFGTRASLTRPWTHIGIQ
nr:uncharacterized protein LOC117681371 isoform X2 [Crassostrea gigas]